MLIERPREVVTRDELQKRLWPGGIVVDFDSGLNKAINRVREALGDDADNPRFIETLPQRGYRFLAQVEISAPAELPLTSAPASVPANVLGTPRRRRFLAITGGLLSVPIVSIGYRFLRSRQQPIESIAVLPLENLSGNPAQDYFSDGMTDELIGEIASLIGSLRVISRTSSMRYKGGARKLLPQIARELNVDAILEGTVVQSGQRVRITAQLIRAQDDRHVFSEQYEGDLTDILALQGDVARAIARQVEIKLTPGEQTSLTRTGPVKPDAYEAYLKGEFFLHKSLPGILKSIEFFRQAIELDPRFAGAHAGLAEALCYAGIFQFRPSAETYPEAQVAARKALELDPSNAGAHNALADVKQGYDWILAAAEAEYRTALELNPSHLLARLWYAEHLDPRRTLRARPSRSRGERWNWIRFASSLGNRAMVFFRSPPLRRSHPSRPAGP